MDIVNPPFKIYVDGDQAPVSLRNRNRASDAVKVPFNSMALVHQGIPKSRTWKLWEHEIYDTLLLSGTS
jgi:hypothetical protein